MSAELEATRQQMLDKYQDFAHHASNTCFCIFFWEPGHLGDSAFLVDAFRCPLHDEGEEDDLHPGLDSVELMARRQKMSRCYDAMIADMKKINLQFNGKEKGETFRDAEGTEYFVMEKGQFDKITADKKAQCDKCATEHVRRKQLHNG